MAFVISNTRQAQGNNAAQVVGVYNQNRRSVCVMGINYPIAYNASLYVAQWQNGAQIWGEIHEEVFHPHIK
jgi:hypothetical protein